MDLRRPTGHPRPPSVLDACRHNQHRALRELEDLFGLASDVGRPHLATMGYGHDDHVGRPRPGLFENATEGHSGLDHHVD